MELPFHSAGRSHFNPRAPCGARRSVQERRCWQMAFQPTRPLRGATITPKRRKAKTIKFQPTRPLRGATERAREKVLADGISTHAPLAGRDHNSKEKKSKNHKISTHAPLAGRDLFQDCSSNQQKQFQPTRPLRGATALSCAAKLRKQDFNPRAPCGARQQKCTNHYAHFCDNRQISDAFAQNAACQGILLLFDAGKPCGFWVRTAQVISAHLCFAL